MSNNGRIVTQGPGNVALRLEIHDLVKNKRQFTLYVRALQQLEAVAEERDPSFFGVSSIHGLPYSVWNGAQGAFQPDKNPNWTFGGYCTHGTVIFPTWHRPYIALYEQLLQGFAKQIATQFTVDQQAWVQEAQNLRQPYWDWAKFALPPDEVIQQANVTITGFSGKDEVVPNPIIRYTFKQRRPLPYFSGTPYEDFQTTLRTPDARGRENIPLMIRVLNQAHTKTTQDCISLLTRVRDWDGFSNHSSSENSVTNSLESIHDNIHSQIGGNNGPGHMGDPAVAAFDPIFYIHHCNVDRMISLWAAINPGVWVSPGDGPQSGTFNLQPDTQVDTNTDLSPFWNSAQAPTFWKSSQVVNTSVLGYNYADFINVDMNDKTAVRNAAISVLQGWRGQSRPRFPIFSNLAATSSLAAAAPQGDSGAAPAQAVLEQPAKPRALASRGVQSHHSSSHHSSPMASSEHHNAPAPAHPHTTISEWTVRVQVKHHELGRSFTVLVFIGAVPENHEEWLTCSTLAGSEHAFVNSAATSCANCKDQTNKVTEGFIHINEFIAEKYPQLGSYEPDVITPLLKDNLHWRVIDAHGAPVELKSLQVTVLCVPMTWEEGSDFPTSGEIHYHHDITHGKSGGYNH